MKPITSVFIQLGKQLADVARAIDAGDSSTLQSTAATGMYRAAIEAGKENAWFTKESIVKSLHALAFMLRPAATEQWLSKYHHTDPQPGTRNLATRSEAETPIYRTDNPQPQKVLVIMAGNIPLVGFHDILCVIASGHHLVAKLSSQDSRLPLALGELLCEIEPELAGHMTFLEGSASDFDAVIATGSNNASRYFDYYFGKYPHIIRKNRTSMALLTGRETPDELTLLGEDVFSYFGLGCRNVSMLWIPERYDLQLLVEAWKGFAGIAANRKYVNNYDFQKAVMLVNKTAFTDIGFCLLKQDSSLHSPVSVVHYQRYDHQDEVFDFIEMNQHNLQCVVSGAQPGALTPVRKNKPATSNNPNKTNHELKWHAVPFISLGASQKPELWDDADGVDTMKFLTDLKPSPRPSTSS